MASSNTTTVATNASWQGRDLEKNEQEKLESERKAKKSESMKKADKDREDRTSAAQKAKLKLKKRPLSIFTGPYFPKPPTDNDPDTQGNRGYEECIYDLVSKPFDADGVYGATEGRRRTSESNPVLFLLILITLPYHTNHLPPLRLHLHDRSINRGNHAPPF